MEWAQWNQFKAEFNSCHLILPVLLDGEWYIILRKLSIPPM